MESSMPDTIVLRDMIETDLPIFFEQEQDKDAQYMAAFTAEDPADRAAFDAHWAKVLNNDAIIKKTVIYNDEVVGNMLHFDQFGKPSVGYWIGKLYWGQGIATRALKAFLEVVTERPLYARVVKDNKGSIRVLEKCGFIVDGEDKGFANARNAEVEEFIMILQ